MDENTTHECPICGDVHLPPSPNEVKDEPTEPESAE